MRSRLLLLIGLACAACTGAAGPAPIPPTASVRMRIALDSLNAAMRAFYAEGGRVDAVQLLHLDAYPPDTTLAPVVVIIVR